MAESARLAAALADRYRIERELGQGGMATVYLAEDPKHNRKVAIKVLKPELAAVLGADRFVQEIQTTAQLQHPNILPLFDSGRTGGTADGRSDDFLYYVMPYVEGETLRQKLDREKQLGVEEAVKLTTEVADALQYAHEQGVIHRDIKPENILLHAGRPIVADFGIALAVSAAAGGRMTETGLSLGTPHYMSPEQAAAEKHITNRSDVYSLAAVLYEMLTGEPPHMGTSAQQIIMKIITDPVQLVTKLRKSVPPNVATAVSKALEKLPADRFDSAKAFADALMNPSFHTEGVAAAASPTALPPSRLTALFAITTVALALAAAWGWLRPAPKTPSPPTTVFGLDMGRVSVTMTTGRLFDVSPDGARFAFVGTDSTGTSRLYVRQSNGTAITPVPGTENASFPAFSPDGQWLAFAQGSDLKKVRLAGGAPLIVARDAAPAGIMWGDRDQIIFGGQRVHMVSGAGGTPREVPLAGDTVPLRWPFLLPGGQYALVTEIPSLARARVAVMNVATGARQVIIREGTDAKYVAPGYIVYGHPAGGVFGVPFDLARRQVTGDPVPLAENVSVFAGGATQFTVSRSGVAAYLGGDVGLGRLVLVGRSGAVTVLPMDAGTYADPRFSPDGRRIVFRFSGEASQDIYVLDRTLGIRSRVTFAGANMYPVWSRDGAWIYFSSDRDGSNAEDGYRRRSDGGGNAERLFTKPGSQFIQALTPGGGLLLREITDQGLDLIVRSPSDTAVRSFLTNPWNEFAATLSRDGRWVAYTSDETGTDEVYVTSFPESTGRWQVSQGGGDEPAWAPDGRGLYYWAGDVLMEARLQAGTTFRIAGRTQVLHGQFQRRSLFAQYDVQPDDRGFVMVQPDSGWARRITVAVNWLTELRARMSGQSGR